MKKHTEEQLRQIAQQLRCPKGDAGKEMAEKMYLTNTDMLVQSLRFLDIIDGSRVLEIGHGNCKHLSMILSQANNVKYCGLEISILMNQEAKRINENYLKTQQAEYILYDGKNLPFIANSFDRIVTVNTLYFFENPIDILKQIYKALKNKGIFILTFQKKEFIQNLSFTKYDFNIYTIEQVREMLTKIGFKTLEEIHKEEDTISKIGEKVTRKYIIIKVIK